MLRAALHPLQAEHAHNHFLQLAAEKGLPAVLLFTGVVYRLLRTPLCPGDWGEDRCFRRGVQSALLGWVVAGLTESLWVVPLDLFLFWFGLAYVTAGRKTMTGEEARMPQQDGGA